MTGGHFMYLGTSGELRVKSKLLERGWNVSSTQIDTGDDVLAILEPKSEVGRVQVKTADAEQHEYGYSAKFRVDASTLKQLHEPPLTYVWLVRLPSAWGTPLVIPQPDLQRFVVGEEMGYTSEYAHSFYVRYHFDDGEVDEILCSDSELTDYVGDFSNWERVERGDD